MRIAFKIRILSAREAKSLFTAGRPSAGSAAFNSHCHHILRRLHLLRVVSRYAIGAILGRRDLKIPLLPPSRNYVRILDAGHYGNPIG